MTPSLDQPTLVHGDSLDVLAELEPASIDAVVHDPPAGVSFMGRAWDNLSGYTPRTERGRQVLDGFGLLGLEPWAAGFVSFMTEVFAAELRVVKPGAHSLTWALPRTADLTMLALRLAGWEVRDNLTHLFGVGFAKSHDVSKAIDKMHGAEREVVGRSRGHVSGNPEQRTAGLVGGSAFAETVGMGMWETAPATEDAKRWEGWGTALSPGHEQWILARAPLVGTVAWSVLEYGTGGLNIDGTRTPTGDEGNPSIERRASARRAGRAPNLERSAVDGLMERRGDGMTYLQDRPGEQLGRWPKNVMLSCSLACDGDRHTPWCPVAELDRQSGMLPSRGNVGPETAQAVRNGTTRYGSTNAVVVPSYTRDDTGGASRFFPRFGYHSKVSDRTIAGRSDLTNKHPTVKSPELMRWLVRLITPPGGVVLDDFMGSGTTGVAAVAEGCRFIGIEREREHFDVARARIMAAIGSPEVAAEANAVAPVGAQLGLL